MSKFRAYGVVGIGVKNGNWNADFDGFPKMVGDMIIGSDKALKYAYRYVEEKRNAHSVMYYKTLKEINEKGKGKTLAPRTLKEKYEVTFDVEDLKQVKDKTSIVKNLLNINDCKTFGFTFAEAGANFESTGCVQVTQGVNVYNESEVVEHTILSPFQDGKSKEKNNGEDSKQSTLGSMVVVDKAQYMYGVTVDPMAIKKYKDLGYTEGFTKEDYEHFKKTIIIAATALNTASKVGAENNFAVFVETDDSLYLGNIANYVSYKYVDNKDVFDISDLISLVKDCGDRITNVEVYYNPYTVKVIAKEDLDKVKRFNILTTGEIKNENS